MPRLATLSGLLAAATASFFAATAAADDGLDLFESEVRPLLIERCYACHSADADEAKGGLYLDSRDGLLAGGGGGPAIEPGEPEASPLIWAVRYDDPLLKMPPDGRLSDPEIAALERWIALGAPDPRDGTTAEPTTPGPSASRDAWAFRRPTRHAPPAVAHADRVRSPVDAFVLARLEADGLEPNPEADRRTLIRRLAFDLTGLPPTPEEVEAFVEDPDPAAYERLVDRLLASPRYGERWARLWLDLARFAEDQAHIVGNDKSLFYPNAYRYRDWVIAAYNDDLPFDDFIRLQLAADLATPDDPDDDPALGFVGLGPKYYGRGSRMVKADEWEDRVDVISRGLLGLTVACARCHDHKFDPIPTADYYALAGVFASTEMFNRPLAEDAETKKDGEAKEPPDALHIIRDGKPTDLHVFIRGNVEEEGDLAPRRFLSALSEGDPAPLGDDGTSGRLDLADAIVVPANPLAARVYVNRVWAQLFGRGIVATPSNFGAMGEPPTHPDLLDDLAVRFLDEHEGAGSTRWLVRVLVTSSTYRQSSTVTDEHRSIDPANELLGRMPRRRLPVEGWRDALLAVAGRLDDDLGGPSIDPGDPESSRRTVYSHVSRLDLDPMLARFDFPDPNAHAAARARTTTPAPEALRHEQPVRRRPGPIARRPPRPRGRRRPGRPGRPRLSPPLRPAAVERGGPARRRLPRTRGPGRPLGRLRPGVAGVERVPDDRLMGASP